jgi:hypothetical protein
MMIIIDVDSNESYRYTFYLISYITEGGFELLLMKKEEGLKNQSFLCKNMIKNMNIFYIVCARSY